MYCPFLCLVVQGTCGMELICRHIDDPYLNLRRRPGLGNVSSLQPLVWLRPECHFGKHTVFCLPCCVSLSSSDGACFQQYRKVQVVIVKFSLYVKTSVALSIFKSLYDDICNFVIFKSHTNKYTLICKYALGHAIIYIYLKI